ncbi:hypothetical protein HAX54_033396 [Datura stramonium]|uniref:Uncharacterized protein n=1 Tax=Datura stramonium TaxID=4076 RepID=A0ABS8SDB4_DATST|nr:hypothetical protein [Datura stramonium]
MTSTGNKKQQEYAASKEIAKRCQLHNESEPDSSSGLEAHYNIETSDESPVVTTKAKSKSQEAAAATASPPQSDEESDEAEFYGDNLPADNAEEGNGNAEKGNDDAKESGDDDTKEEESDDKESVAKKSSKQVGDSNPATTKEVRSKRQFLQGSRDVYYAELNLNEKGNPSRSIQEEPKTQINALNQKKAPSKSAIKKKPVLDSVRVRAILVNISERTITRVLIGGDYTVLTRTTEYDY